MAALHLGQTGTLAQSRVVVEHKTNTEHVPIHLHSMEVPHVQDLHLTGGTVTRKFASVSICFCLAHNRLT